MDDVLIGVMVRLLRVHDELGERCFEEAAHGAMVAIGRAAQLEANRRAGMERPAYGEGILPFPTSRR